MGLLMGLLRVSALVLLAASVALAQEGCEVPPGGRAIPLVVSTRRGDRMVACTAGLRYLAEELGDAQLSVTAIFGKARKGKPFFLNNLIGEHEAGLDDMGGCQST